MRETAVFFWNAMRSRTVCAVAPSSLPTVKKVCQDVPTDRPIGLIEYGPGTGVFTRYLAERLHPDSTILAIELNAAFYKELVHWREQAKPQVRVVLEHGSCADVLAMLERHSLPPADFALSGIPFSILSERLRMDIVRKTYRALAPGGVFLVYQYSYFMVPRLERVFDQVDRSVSVMNLPPTMIMAARRSAASAEEGREVRQGGRVAEPCAGTSSCGRTRGRAGRRSSEEASTPLPASADAVGAR